MGTEFGICPIDRSSLQQQNKSSDNWIGAYMEWMDMEWTDRIGSGIEASAGSSELCVVAYLEWMDAKLSVDKLRPSRQATASANYRRRKDDVMREPDAVVCAVLLATPHNGLLIPVGN